MKMYYILGMICLMTACQPKSNKAHNETPQISVPVFSEDSAYQHVATQVGFGPRVPNTEAHRQCADYLSAYLEKTGAEVIRQKAVVNAFDGTPLNIENIIGSFASEKQRRILLCAHWDSRPFADEESDAALQRTPIDGANDGASGVGVLLELARHIGKMPLNVGVDIVLFDAEDYGVPSFSNMRSTEDSWCLGSQYWAKHPHKAGYKAEYAILLDMVGAPNAQFNYEYFSYQYGAHILEKVWKKGQELGYGSFFLTNRTYPVTDDHYYINTLTNIPCINIIHQDMSTEHGFCDVWHTQKDNMQHIDKTTLGVVGKTLLHVLANE